MADYPPVVAHEPELELPGVQRVKHSDPVPKLELPSVHRKEHGNPVLKLELPSVQTEEHGVPIPKLEVSSGELMLASKSHPELVMGLIDLPGGEKVGLGCLQPAARNPDSGAEELAGHVELPLTAESLPELVLGHRDLFRESFSQDVARLESLNHFVLDSDPMCSISS